MEQHLEALFICLEGLVRMNVIAGLMLVGYSRAGLVK